jgi:hypothetical protein
VVGKPERNRLLRRPSSKWETKFEMDLKEMGKFKGWIHLAQNRDIL